QDAIDAPTGHVVRMHQALSVLVIEDQHYARQALVTTLVIHGCQVSEAANGREALHLLTEGSAPDVILLDLVMPIMDGWEFLKTRQKDPRLGAIPVIVVSGVSSHSPRC